MTACGSSSGFSQQVFEERIPRLVNGNSFFFRLCVTSSTRFSRCEHTRTCGRAFLGSLFVAANRSQWCGSFAFLSEECMQQGEEAQAGPISLHNVVVSAVL